MTESLFEGIAEAMEGVTETMNVEAEDENKIIESSGIDESEEDSAGSECICDDSAENENGETEECGEKSYGAAEEPGLIESVFNFIDTIKNDEVSREIAFEEFGEMCRDSINELCDILKEFPKIFEKE
ncbi:hypothetical protein J6253_06535 [bacterium]|nr:hypothetical protein [bacterium]MBP5590439.1 hypothetical protein [bacterium]